jgi:hypothetical protein
MIRRVCVPTTTQVALAALLACTALQARAQQPITVELHHRSAESLVGVLRPLLAPAVVAGAGTRLQVRAAPADLARALRLIEQADLPLRPLIVSLRDDPPSFAPGGATEGGMTAGLPAVAADAAKAGSVTLSTGRPLATDAHGNAQVLSTRQGPQPAQLLEGDALLLSMPAPQSLWFGLRGSQAAPGGKTAGRPSVAGSTDAAGVVQFDAVSDFTARIWVAGETVAIDLQPRVAGRISGAADAGADHATVYGRTGQWIALADSGAELAPAGVAESAAPRAGLWIKVEVAPSFAPDTEGLPAGDH